MLNIAGLALLVLALLLGGCQSVPAKPDVAGRDGARNGQDVRDECDRRLGDPAIDPLRSRIAVELEAKSSPRMLADPAKPTKAEKEAILVYAKRREECARAGFEWLKQYYSSAHVAMAEAQHAENRLLLADLYAGKLSFGQFSTRKQTQLADSRARRIEFERLIVDISPSAQKGAQQIVDDYKRVAEHDTRAAVERNKGNMEWMRLYKAVAE